MPTMKMAAKATTAKRKLKKRPGKDDPQTLADRCGGKRLGHRVPGESSPPAPPRPSSRIPPGESRETWYWVSPIFFPNSLGPKPREKVRTPTLDLLAMRKWPSSWTKIKTPKTMIVAMMVVITDLPRSMLFWASCRAQAWACRISSRVRLYRRPMPVHDLADQAGNLQKSQPPLQESFHGDLVGRVQNRRAASRPLPGRGRPAPAPETAPDPPG